MEHNPIKLTSDRGAMAVEFGIMFPLIALLLAGLVAFGLAYSTQLTLKQAAREGVRVYALGSGNPIDVTQNAATNLTGVAVTTSGDCPDPNSPPDPAPPSWVEASYTFTVPFPFPWWPGSANNIPLSARAVMRCGG